jgi:hypothetical protein
MGLLTHRRPQSLAKYMLFALTVVLAAATLAVVASGGNSKSYADGQGSPAECSGNPNENPNSDNVISSVSPADAAAGVEVPAGNVVLGVCIKAGNPHSGPLGDGFYDADFNPVAPGEACFEVSGVGTQEVTVTDLAAGDCEGAGLSHIDVIFGPAPPPTTGPPPTTAGPPTTAAQPPAPGAPAAAVVARPVFTG